MGQDGALEYKNTTAGQRQPHCYYRLRSPQLRFDLAICKKKQTVSCEESVRFAEVFLALASLAVSERILFEDRFGYGMPNHVIGSKG